MFAPKFLLATLLATTILIPASNVSAADCISLASDQNTKLSQAFSPKVTKVFNAAGICVTFVDLPNKRANKALINGQVDGEMLRAMAYIKQMGDNVVHIPTPVASASGVIVTLKKSGFLPKGAADVGDKKIGIVRGNVWQEAVSKGFKSVSENKTYALLAKQLAAGRIDGVLVDSLTLQNLYKGKVLTENDVHVSGPLLDLSGYVVLDKKHEGLVSKIDAAMKSAS